MMKKKSKKLYVIVTVIILLCYICGPIAAYADTPDNSPNFTTKRMDNAEAAQKAYELAIKYNTLYVNGTVGQPLKQYIINDTIDNTLGNTDRAERNKKRVEYNYYAFDCSGMVNALCLWNWEGEQLNYNPKEDQGELKLLQLCGNTLKSDFDDYDSIWPGEYLYKNGHCGIYIGGGYAVECTANWRSGAQITRVVLSNEPDADKSEPATRWEKHGKLPFIEYKYKDLYYKSSNGMLQLNKKIYNPGEPIQIKVKGVTDPRYCKAYLRINNSFECYVGSGTHEPPCKEKLNDVETVYLSTKKYELGGPSVLYFYTCKIELISGDSESEEETLDTITFNVEPPQIVKALINNKDGDEKWIDISINGYVTEDAWVGLYPAETTDLTPSIAWYYATKEVTSRHNYGYVHHVTHIRFKISDSEILNNPAAFKATLYMNDYYAEASSSPIALTYMHIDILTKYSTSYFGIGKISTGGKTTYKFGDEIKIDFSGLSEETNSNAWIGLYSEDTTDYNSCSTGMWVYTATGKQWEANKEYSKELPSNGTVYLHANAMDVNTGTVMNLPAGNYKLVLFGDGGYTSVLDVIHIVITD